MYSDPGYTVTEAPLDPTPIKTVTPEKITDPKLSEVSKSLFHINKNGLGKLRENVKSIDVSKLPVESEDPIERGSPVRDSPKRRRIQFPKRSRAESEFALQGTELNVSKKEEFFTIITPEEAQRMKEEKARQEKQKRLAEELKKRRMEERQERKIVEKMRRADEKNKKFQAAMGDREKKREMKKVYKREGHPCMVFCTGTAEIPIGSYQSRRIPKIRDTTRKKHPSHPSPSQGSDSLYDYEEDEEEEYPSQDSDSLYEEDEQECPIVVSPRSRKKVHDDPIENGSPNVSRKKVRDTTRKQLVQYPTLSLAESIPPNFVLGGMEMELNVSKRKDFFTIAMAMPQEPSGNTGP
eukprot:sb/3466211/